MAADISRRQFFRLGLNDVTAGLRRGKDRDGSSRAEALFRPPGAVREDDFPSTCERCHKCVDACPAEVIGIMGPAAGASGGTPVLEPGPHRAGGATICTVSTPVQAVLCNTDPITASRP